MSEEKYWVYHPRVIGQGSKGYYEVLKALMPEKQDKIKVYGKEYDEPRFKRFFSRDGHSYTYSSIDNESSGWPKEIEQLAKLAKEIIGCEKDFDSALVNYYANGTHGVGTHNDKDAKQGYIASFSFGATEDLIFETSKQTRL
jgi:alkylated DNA repair dioxygenase AlkB